MIVNCAKFVQKLYTKKYFKANLVDLLAFDFKSLFLIVIRSIWIVLSNCTVSTLSTFLTKAPWFWISDFFNTLWQWPTHSSVFHNCVSIFFSSVRLYNCWWSDAYIVCCLWKSYQGLYDEPATCRFYTWAAAIGKFYSLHWFKFVHVQESS